MPLVTIVHVESNTLQNTFLQRSANSFDGGHARN